jgi:hypothetical protein
MTIQFDHLKLPTLSFLCGPLCLSVARKTKRTQFPALSSQKQGSPKKRTQFPAVSPQKRGLHRKRTQLIGPASHPERSEGAQCAVRGQTEKSNYEITKRTQFSCFLTQKQGLPKKRTHFFYLNRCNRRNLWFQPPLTSGASSHRITRFYIRIQYVGFREEIV